MTVWHLIATMRTERETLEQTAENFGLPLEAVLESMHYYILHKDVVEADVEAEKRVLVEEFGDGSGGAHCQRNLQSQSVALAAVGA